VTAINKRIHEDAIGAFDDLAASAVTNAQPDERGRLIGRLVGNRKRVLDVGCGYGLMMSYLRSLDNEIVGLEITSGFVKICRRFGFTVYETDVENDPLPAGLGTFDVVLCMETLEHLMDPLLVLQEKIRPLLKPGGQLVVTVPNGAYLKDRLTLLCGRAPTFGSGTHLLPYRPYNLDHKTIFTVSGLRETFTLAGFEVERLFPTPGYVPGLVLKSRTQRLWNQLAWWCPGLFARDLMCVGRMPPA
jgi:methionine biosynthesis protein MetW